MKTLPESDLLAYLRQPGFSDEDCLARLSAIAASFSCVPAIVDAIDGAIKEIEGWQDKQRDAQRDEDEWEKLRTLRRSWAVQKDREQGIPAFISRAVL